eukprot:scaffold15484_cov30-Tisochrysis_lutea.AAC.3
MSSARNFGRFESASAERTRRSSTPPGLAARLFPAAWMTGVIGHHACHGAEERLEIVRELRAPSVSGIHCDEHSTRGIQANFSTLENESLLARHRRLLNGRDLLCHDREHLEIDSVKLVEAGPCA